MPGAKTHDAVTFLLAAPTFAVAYLAFGDLRFASLTALGFLFGGLMFGPDLDTVSKQYSRWRFLRILWFPYRSFFKHRSRWSHGLIFGTFLRVVYFMGVVTCAVFLILYLAAGFTGGELPSAPGVVKAWSRLREFSDAVLGSHGLIGLFVGMWIGAASHTFTDIAGTYVKTGRGRL
jgi:uncharacterized metal-binding protein